MGDPIVLKDTEMVVDHKYITDLREEAKANRLLAEAKEKEFADKLKAIEDAKLTANQEFEKLANDRKAEIDALTPFKTKAEILEKKNSEMEAERKTELLSRIDDEEERKNWEDADLSTIKKAVSQYERLKAKTVIPGEGHLGKLKIEPNKKWDDYTSDELEEIEKSMPDVYNKLRKDKFKR